MYCFQVIKPKKQLALEVDHSLDSAKFREDGLQVGNMSVKFGGKQKVLCDTRITKGWFDPQEAKMHLHGELEARNSF